MDSTSAFGAGNVGSNPDQPTNIFSNIFDRKSNVFEYICYSNILNPDQPTQIFSKYLFFVLKSTRPSTSTLFVPAESGNLATLCVWW